jgi:hypothetical protein
MVLDAEASSEFGVCMTNAEFLSELSVGGKMRLVRGVLCI